MNVLIVDDDIVDRKLIKRKLNSSADSFYNIQECDSVAEGLLKVSQHPFDVILLDYQMPEVDGIEMVIELRAKVNLGNTAIVMISNSDDSALMLDCIEAGAQDFLSKSEITLTRLKKSILHATKRCEIELRIHARYLQIKEIAEKDPLTGISNRYHFEESLKAVIENNKRSKHKVALLVFDLDDFKHINDTMGHSAGDAVLVQSVGRIKACLRSNEGFARLGGDEFAVIIGDISCANEVNQIAKRILGAFNKIFMVDKKVTTCSVSIGVSLFPDDSYEALDLLKCADIAMYRAKKGGKNTLSFYQKSYQEEFNRRFSIQNEIKSILDTSSFSLVYQPIFCTKKDMLVGFEALIRWPETTKKYTPDEFIPVAEETRLINSIGKWVIAEAVQQLAIWQSNYNEILSMSINISPIQLFDDDLIDFLDDELKKNKVSPCYITLEITETALIKDNKKITETLNILSKSGYKIALDDFGMGFSSIAHLMNYPIDIVKIDKSMQSTNNSSEKQRKVFDALSLMLKELSFIIVAEGIETPEQLELCRTLGLDRAQGYLLGRPFDSESSTHFLNAIN